ncbi:FAD-binding oxidoreductase [Alteromonas aestuariivivens]|uniref:FAD-binding oxidoreductase n=1 Tax=Alteromonas aestuariivivens TaxID=1938339 RepID=A0A3D8MG87_9ALTE|nr:FAD-binding oxidoreductase [Alteromonas aestuariivivens]RDV29238.1 FAD-binding oxidoreductase [Alteromonas aestuariivivens]
MSNASYAISGKIKIDWQQFQQDLNGIKVLSKPAQVKKHSRDFFWYSPILERQLSDQFADIVVQPQTQQELLHCLEVAYRWDMPIVVRGGGTGNYGQAVPLAGGMIIDVNAINQILEIGEGYVRVEAGCNIELLNQTLKQQGYELPVFPSTQNIATVGGFVAGGSAGIGTMNNGPLREKGNIICLKVYSVEAQPQCHYFENDDTLLVHHAWGINGVITEVTLRTVPSRTWHNCIATFDTYPEAYEAALAIAKNPHIECKLLSVLDHRYRTYFTALDGYVPTGKALMVTMVDDREVDALQAAIENHKGVLELSMTNEQIRAEGLPLVYEFSYNHSNLQVLKADKAMTYLQVSFPQPLTVEKVREVHELVKKEVFQHHEFAVLNGELISFDVPILRYTTDVRLYEIIGTYEACGCPVADPHKYQIEAGSMHNANFTHLAWKKRLDPKQLLNPGKSMAWEKVKDMTPEQIENLSEI